ncbi:Pkinase-domain-containing protein [Rhizodiscina lignyota]|uniref:Pkinase-domain-containing protein n=1 Tax=Rhizodiscina lignyota TaxID=1504668 RepID=A0A9P4MBW7_9PEZI|nr:Pkinase-domain-containing protein [Rhizodiscina lignyota]
MGSLIIHNNSTGDSDYCSDATSSFSTTGNYLSSPLSSQSSESPVTTAKEEYAQEDAIWGYLYPHDPLFGDPLKLARRDPCYECSARSSGKGYLLGNHSECDRSIHFPTVSERHCVIFPQGEAGTLIAYVQDLSTLGTFVNGQLVGQNRRRRLRFGDQISFSVTGAGLCSFWYVKRRQATTFVAKYSQRECIGKGHFAKVYRCVERSTGKQYAVKRSAPNHTFSIREIGVMMSLKHRRILDLRDVFTETAETDIVMELGAGGSLFDRVRIKKLKEPEARKVFKQLGEALKYLHNRDIVHRDIKPENILFIDHQLNIKLCDFGLAQVGESDYISTEACGTPAYMAPELVGKERRHYTCAVDIWAAGVVLYVSLCGFPPFSDELYSPSFPFKMREQIQLGQFTFTSPYWDTISNAAVDLVGRMLTVDPDLRPTIEDCLAHPWTTAASHDELKWRDQGLPADYTKGNTETREFSSPLAR